MKILLLSSKFSREILIFFQKGETATNNLPSQADYHFKTTELSDGPSRHNCLQQLNHFEICTVLWVSRKLQLRLTCTEYYHEKGKADET